MIYFVAFVYLCLAAVAALMVWVTFSYIGKGIKASLNAIKSNDDIKWEEDNETK